MRRTFPQELPDGTVRQLHPFHISMEGLETAVLCRDDADYDAMVSDGFRPTPEPGLSDSWPEITRFSAPCGERSYPSQKKASGRGWQL